MNTTPQPPFTTPSRCLSFVSLFKVFIITPLFILPLAFSSCLKDPEPAPYVPIAERPENFPAITTQGLGTFGCYIDGKPYIGGAYPWTQLSAEYNNGLLRIYSKRNKVNEPLNGIDIYYTRNDARITEPGIYELKFKDLAKDGYARYTHVYSNNYVPDSDEFYLDTVSLGKLTILRLDSRIISGLFEFSAYNKLYNRTVKITDGRFDISY